MKVFVNNIIHYFKGKKYLDKEHCISQMKTIKQKLQTKMSKI